MTELQLSKSWGSAIFEFTCEKLDSVCRSKHTEHANGCCMNAGEVAFENITPKFVVRDDCKSTCSGMDFLSSMVGTTSFALVDMPPAVAIVKGSLAKRITSVDRASASNRLAKCSFTPLMKSVITSVICAGDEMLLRSAGKCSILPVLQSFAKRASMTWTRICSTGSSQFLSLPCHSGISPNLFKDYLENCVYVWRVWRVKTSVVFI